MSEQFVPTETTTILPPTPDSWSHFLNPYAQIMSGDEALGLASKDYFGHINGLVREVVGSADYHDSETGYISDIAWQRLVEGGMLAPFLKDRDGIADAHRQREIMTMTRILSYYDTNLGLACGIVGALGIVPIQMFGSPSQQDQLLGLVRSGKKIGLAITETQKSGTTALTMDSTYAVKDGNVTVSFDKHFQGHSREAGLIVAAKATDGKVGFVFVPQEHIDTTLLQTEALEGIRYGVNRGNVELNADQYLLAQLDKREGYRKFQDVFNKSRLGFAGMTLGQQERMEWESGEYARNRRIGGVAQEELPVPAETLREICARRMISGALFEAGVTSSGFDDDTQDLALQAAIIKTLSTEYSLKTALDRARLQGAQAFNKGGALHDFANIWPFMIFEGTQDFMYAEQIGAASLRREKTTDGHVPGFTNNTTHTNLHEFFMGVIANKPLFSRGMALSHLEESTIQALREIKSSQKGISNALNEPLGRIIVRLFALGQMNEGTSDGNSETFADAVALLNHEIRGQADRYQMRQARIRARQIQDELI